MMSRKMITAIRVRPPLSGETYFMDIHSPGIVHLGHHQIPFVSDFAFDSRSNQEYIFEISVKHLLQRVTQGENISVLAYGQKGGGKTYTLFGSGGPLIDSSLSFGIFQRFATHIFTSFAPTHTASKNSMIKVEVAFYNINEAHEVKDLITNQIITLEPPHGSNKEELLSYSECSNAREMISLLHTALQNRYTEPSHMVADIVLLQPCIRSGIFGYTRSSAKFFDIGNTKYLGNNRQWTHEDRYSILSLACNINGLSLSCQIEGPLKDALQPTFEGERLAIMFCCIGQKLVESQCAVEVVQLHSAVTEIMSGSFRNRGSLRENVHPSQLQRHSFSQQQPIPQQHVMNQQQFLPQQCVSQQQYVSQQQLQLHVQQHPPPQHQTSPSPSPQPQSLISEAEYLFTKLSVSSSVSKEDQEKLRNWLHMKKEYEDESLKSHGQLECIEEVTESEEEIASSDEKMSVSPVSLGNSYSESDQEEGNTEAPQQDDDNFFNNLDIMIAQFNVFVDKFIESYKEKVTLTPAKEHKCDYSATRRGGLVQPRAMGYQSKSETNQSSSTDDPLDEALAPGVDACLRSRRKPTSSSMRSIPSSSGSKNGEEAHVKRRDQRVRRGGDLNNLSDSFTENNTKQLEQTMSHSAEMSMGCRRKTSTTQCVPRCSLNNSEAEEDVSQLKMKVPSDRRRRERNVQHSSSDANAKVIEKSENSDSDGEAREGPLFDQYQEDFFLWGLMGEDNQPTYTDLYSWLKKEAGNLLKVKDTWKTQINQSNEESNTLKAAELEKTKGMFFAVCGLANILRMMSKILQVEETPKSCDYFGLKHFIRIHRQWRQYFVTHKCLLGVSVKNKTASEESVKDHIMADEMVETIDSCIEFLNFMVLNNASVEPKLPNTDVGLMVMKKLKTLSLIEMRHMIFKYFNKVIELRENSKQMENTIAELEIQKEMAAVKINNLHRTIINMRNEMEQMRYAHQTEETYGEHHGTSSHLALPEGSKQKRISGTTKTPCIPQQNLSKLQVTKAPPPAKVTITHKKLIIEKPNKDKN